MRSTSSYGSIGFNMVYLNKDTGSYDPVNAIQYYIHLYDSAWHEIYQWSGYTGSYPIWTANPSGGSNPYQYYWQMRYYPWAGGSWTSWSDFGNQQSEGMTYDSSIYEVELQVTVTDAGSNRATDTFYAYFDHPNNPVTARSDSIQAFSTQ